MEIRLKAFVLVISSAIVVLFPYVASILSGGEGVALLGFREGVEFDGTRVSVVEPDDRISDRYSCNGFGCEDERVVFPFCSGGKNRRILQVTSIDNLKTSPRLTRVLTSSSESFAAPRSSHPPIPSTLGDDDDSGKNGINAGVFWAIGLVSALLLIVLVYLIFVRGKRLATVAPWATGLSGQLRRRLKSGASSLKRSELETACEDFSNIIGSLSDGKLYKGTLSSGVEIAASVLSPKSGWSKHHEVQFMKKVQILSKVDHKNFVNILGYCKQDKPFTRVMVFEYAPNGTLFDHLHVRDAQDLNWAARLRILMGVAYCLDYMHQMEPPIILKDLNSNLIHLTDDLAAKVSDLELCSGTAERQGSIVVKFGILILELVTGKPLYSDEDGGLVIWANDYLKGLKPLKHMVDSSLNSFSEQEAVDIINVVKACLDPDPRKRLSMNEVAKHLRDITSITPKVAAPRSSPLWWAELEIISSES